MQGNFFDRRRAIGTGLATGASLLLPRMADAAVATTVGETDMHGRRALKITNGKLALSVAPGGGFIGDLRLVSKNPRLDISPMRVPPYQTIDPYTFDLKRDGPVYGTGDQRQLMSGYMGHYTAFPQFGHSEAEFKTTGYGQHGEAILVKWERLPSAPADLVMAAYLPQNQYQFQRAIRMLPGETVAYVTETAENLEAYERPLQWVQHVTMGPPWAEIGKMWADASVDQVLIGRGAAARLAAWPQSADLKGQMVDYRAFVGTPHTWLMQRSQGHNWITAYHQDYDVLFGHVYDASINPWVLDWQNNKSGAPSFPDKGIVTARGFCWGDSPSAGGIKGAVLEGQHAGVPTYSWIGSRATRSQRYAIFMTPIPKGWQGVADLAAGNGAITITERGSGRKLTVKAADI